LQQDVSGVKLTLALEDVLRVAGHVNDREVWHSLSQLIAQLFAVHAGHDHVGDDQVKLLLGEHSQRLLAGGRLGNVKAGALKKGARRFAQHLLVVHQKDARIAGDWRGVPGFGCGGGFHGHHWEIKTYRGADSGRAGNADVAVVPLNDAIADGESEAGAFALWLGGKERFKDAGLDFRGNSAACVAYADADIVSGRSQALDAGQSRPDPRWSSRARRVRRGAWRRGH